MGVKKPPWLWGQLAGWELRARAIGLLARAFGELPGGVELAGFTADHLRRRTRMRVCGGRILATISRIGPLQVTCLYMESCNYQHKAGRLLTGLLIDQRLTVEG